MKWLVAGLNQKGEHVYLRRPNRFGSWTYFRPDARRFGSEQAAKRAASRAKKLTLREAVTALEEMDFRKVPPERISRIKETLMKRVRAQGAVLIEYMLLAAASLAGGGVALAAISQVYSDLGQQLIDCVQGIVLR